MLMNAPQCVHRQCPCPRISRSCPPTPASPRDPPRPAGSYGPMCMRSWTSPPRVKFLFSPVLWSSCTQTSLPLKPNALGSHSSLCQTPRLGNLTWAPELSFLWENFYGINCSLVCGLLIPEREYGI